MNISVVYPIYNEEENIKKVILDTIVTLELLVDDFEIIAVNDGSTDSTYTILKDLSQEDSHIRIIHKEQNEGYGAALRDGFKNAKYEYIFYSDSDNQFDIQEIKFLIDLIQNADIAVGYRLNRQDPWIRKFLSFGFNKMMRILFNVKLRDIDCAFKLFRKEIFNHFNIESNNFFVDIEMIAKAVNLGYKVREIGVHHYPRIFGNSSVNPSDIPRTIRETIRIYGSIKKLKK